MLETLTVARAEVKNRILGLLDKHGLRVPGATPFSKGNIAWLRGLSLGFMGDAILGSLAARETIVVYLCQSSLEKGV